MHFCSALALAACVVGTGCRTVRTPPPPHIAPDVHAWRGKLPTATGVAEYAQALERLNSTRSVAFDATDGLSLEEGEAVALLFNADVRVARLKADVPLLGARFAGLRDDPRIELDLLRVLQGIASPWTLISSLQFTVPLAGRLTGERALAFADASAARAEAHVAEWNLVVQVREAWSEWSATRERFELVEQHLESINAVLVIAKRQREAQQISSPQVRILGLESLSHTGELAALRRKANAQLMSLKSLLGMTPYANVTLNPEIVMVSGTVNRQKDEAQLQRVNLELALAKAEFIKADRVLRHEVTKRFPDMSLGPIFESEEGIERLGLGVGVTLPLWNRNRRAIVEACATRRVARSAFQARYQDLIARLARACADQSAMVARGKWIQEQIAPLADEQLNDVKRLSELGDMDVLLLKDALATLLDAKIQLLDVRLEQALAASRRRALIEPLRTPILPTGSR